jgi:hypothetical protein
MPDSGRNIWSLKYILTGTSLLQAPFASKLIKSWNYHCRVRVSHHWSIIQASVACKSYMLVSVPWVIRRRNLFNLSIRNDRKWNFEVLRNSSHLSTMQWAYL